MISLLVFDLSPQTQIDQSENELDSSWQYKLFPKILVLSSICSSTSGFFANSIVIILRSIYKAALPEIDQQWSIECLLRMQALAAT